MERRATLLFAQLLLVTLGACMGEVVDSRTKDDVDSHDASSTNGGDTGSDSGADANNGGATANSDGGMTNSNGSSNGTSSTGSANTGGNNSGTSGTTNGTTSNGGGTTTGASSSGGDEDASTPSGRPVFVAAGWAGRRVYSTDLGLNWTDVSDTFNGGGGDDDFLLRAIGHGHGLFVAVGWKILTSPDGVTWTSRKPPQTQWLGGIQLAASGRLVATGGFGYSTYSADAITWKLGGTVGDNVASRSLAYGNGMFVTATDGGEWWSSSDGLSWASFSDGHDDRAVAFCDAQFKAYDTCTSNYIGKLRAQGEGITVRVENGDLQRATDGKTFTTVLSAGQPLEDVVFGYAP